MLEAIILTTIIFLGNISVKTILCRVEGIIILKAEIYDFYLLQFSCLQVLDDFVRADNIYILHYICNICLVKLNNF